MRKVLVLEDESSIRSFIVINLRRAGYDVIEAGSGEEALECLKENPDTKVALLDIMLPGLTDLRFAGVFGRRIQRSALLCSPPVLRRWIR